MKMNEENEENEEKEMVFARQINVTVGLQKLHASRARLALYRCVFVF